jgi:hypothetical protein
MVRWADPGVDSEPILGYRLQLTDQVTEARSIIYDSPTNPNVYEFLASNLIKGRSYGFEVLAINFNGAGEEWSDVASFRACTVPVNVPVPLVTEQSASQLSFSWAAPEDDGGCEITGYELQVDNKATGLLEVAFSGLTHVT